tara:strand:+ start:4099 stop:5262 length:1164 start_codon:yes stop_codon:yes gene_type:complete
MNEKELLYHFPYSIDKQNNFRHFVNDDKKFVQKFIPNYDGTNITEFIEKNTNLTKSEELDFYYSYSEFSKWSTWFKNGKNIFSFSKELLSMLEKTDVSEITPDNFHLPYDIFYLSLKSLNIKISKDSEEIIEGVYIDHQIWDPSGNHPEGYCELTLNFVGNFKKIHKEFSENVKSRTEYKINDTIKYHEYPLGSFWDIWLWFDKRDGRENVKQTIDYYLEGLKEEIFPRKNSNDILTDFDLDFYNSTVELLNNTINLVVNCILYLSQPTEKKDIENKFPVGLPNNFDKQFTFAKTQKETNKINEKIEKLGFTKINYVGQSFKKNYEKYFNNSTVQPHWRRGHWRKQKFGENLKDSKTIWILPTIVKSEKGNPEKGHVYDVKEKTTNA